MTVELIDKINAIADTFEKAGCPLSDEQQALMAGCITVCSDESLERVFARVVVEAVVSGIIRDLYVKPRDTQSN